MDGNIWATLVQVTQMLLFFAVLAVIVLFFLPVIQTSQHYQAEKARLAREIAQAQETTRRLQLEVEQLKNNSSYIEGKARDKLNLGRPGEVIFRFDPYQNTPSGSTPGGN